jgi:hypothetical protein
MIDEKGFVYPLTMILLTFMAVFLLMMTQQYIGEKRFKKETEAIRLQEYYMISSMKLAEQKLRESNLEASETYKFNHGNVDISKAAVSDLLEDITFTLTLDSGHKFIGIGTYDKEKGRMVKWKERN